MKKPSILANKDRAAYEYLLEKYKGQVVRQDFVRLENRIVNNQSQYVFDPRQVSLKDNSFRVNQKGIDDNNVFVATELVLSLDCRKISEQSAAVLQTFPNPTAFAPSNITVEHLEAFYNGTHTLQVGQDIWIDNQTNRVFRTVPITQETSTLLAQSNNEDDFKSINPFAVLSGKAKNTFTVSINTFVGFDVEANVETGTLEYENVLTVELRGYTIVNASR